MAKRIPMVWMERVRLEQQRAVHAVAPEQALPAGPARRGDLDAPPAPRRPGAATAHRPHTLKRISRTSPSTTS